MGENMKRGITAFGLFVTGMIILALGIQLIWIVQAEQSQYEKSRLPITTSLIITEYTGNITQKWTNEVPILFSGDRIDYYFRIDNQTVINVQHTDYNTYTLNSSYTYTQSQYQSGYNPFPEDIRFNNRMIELIWSPIGASIIILFSIFVIYFILYSREFGLRTVRQNNIQSLIRIGTGCFGVYFFWMNIFVGILFSVLMILFMIFYYGFKYIAEEKWHDSDVGLLVIGYLTFLIVTIIESALDQDYMFVIGWSLVTCIMSIIYYKNGEIPKFIIYLKTEKVMT
jgi:hypothetical protein